ncbi:hypothetical protein [Paenibacillus sp. GCM10023250]|uniref:hypothetical protein n=1 Tax=Paenibacillus sp. GCM10023250 TaxID=3252648 RepID=UPI00361772A5
MTTRRALNRKGIHYDVGTHTRGQASSSREAFEPDVVRREMAIIRHDLNCNAVRISGQDLERLTAAAGFALEQGLEVWFSPAFVDADEARTLAYFEACAEAAERLRQRYPSIVFVAGCELTLFMKGLVAGETAFDRMGTFMNPWKLLLSTVRRGSFHKRLNAFLAKAAAVVRRRFHGPVTYASGTWEQVDWAPFDIVGVDAYRDRSNADKYREMLQGCFKHGKPVAILEFGCCTYTGAADKGGYGWAIVDRNPSPPRLKGEYARDEDEQVRYMDDLLTIFEEEGVDAAFWFTFVMPYYPHREEPALDLDIASYGVVKSTPGRSGAAYPGMPWEPKAAFARIAARYRET